MEVSKDISDGLLQEWKYSKWKFSHVLSKVIDKTVSLLQKIRSGYYGQGLERAWLQKLQRFTRAGTCMTGTWAQDHKTMVSASCPVSILF